MFGRRGSELGDDADFFTAAGELSRRGASGMAWREQMVPAKAVERQRGLVRGVWRRLGGSEE